MRHTLVEAARAKLKASAVGRAQSLATGKRGADVRPDFSWNRRPVAMRGYR